LVKRRYAFGQETSASSHHPTQIWRTVHERPRASAEHQPGAYD
jgi:hypothetical protein